MGSALKSHTLTTVGKPVREGISIGHHYNNTDERWGWEGWDGNKDGGDVFRTDRLYLQNR